MRWRWHAAAALAAAWVGLAAAASPGDEPEPTSPRRDGGTAGAPDGGPTRDPDQEVIEHLDELQQLDLLQHLGLLDASGDDEAPQAPPEKGPAR